MSFRIFPPSKIDRRSLSLDELHDLLNALNAEIASLPAGPKKDRQIAHRREIESDIKMLRWADAPALKPPTG